MAAEKLDILVINNMHPHDKSGFNDPLTELFADFSDVRVETVSHTEVQHGELRGDQHDLVVASGVPNNDDYPGDMIYALFGYLQDVLDNRQALFAVCAAYQALHVMRGGTLDKLDRPEVGPIPLTITEPRHPLFAGIDDNSLIFNNHSFHITRPGDGLRQIARTVDCPQAISSSVDNRVSGSQGHIERSGAVGRQIGGNLLHRLRTFDTTPIVDSSSLHNAESLMPMSPAA